MPLRRHLQVRGLRFQVLEWGESGPPALLAHATGFHAALWEPFAEALVERYHVFAPDARGHGGSDKPSDGYAWSENAADLIALADGLGITGMLGIAHSYGATAMALAAAERPDLFERLVLIDPTLLEPGSPSRMAEGARNRRNSWPSRAEVTASYRSKPPFETWDPTVLDLYVEHGTVVAEDGEVTLACPPQVEARVYEGGRTVDVWPALEHLTMPVLVLYAEHGSFLDEQRLERARVALANARFVMIGETSHLLPMEEPAKAIEAIDRFLAEGEPAVRGGSLAHVALNVVDLERAERFYRDQFGMQVVWRPDADNVYLSSGRDNLALHRAEAGDRSARSPLDHIGFVVENREEVFAAAERLEARGVTLTKAPRVHRDESASFYLDDPEGNLVQVIHLPNSMLPARGDRSAVD